MENFTKEQLEKVKSAKSKEEILSYAKEQGFDISDSEAGKIYEYFNSHGELSEDELNSISGGGCNDGGATPKFAVNSTVYIVISSYARKSHVAGVSSTKKKFGLIFKDNTWSYCVVCDEDPYKGLVKNDVPEYDLSSKPQEKTPPVV